MTLVLAGCFSPIAADVVPPFVPSQKQAQIDVISTQPRIYYIRNFLSSEECDHIIDLARPQLTRSSVIDDKSGGTKIDPARTSQGMFFEQFPKDSLLKEIDKRVVALTLIPLENTEAIQVLQYKTGAEFKPHWDYFDPSTVGGIENLKRGGQRVATLILYLNTPQKGGETVFPKIDKKVKAEKGNAVLFYNCTPDGNVDPLTMHGGAPVVKGEKWIATKWFHAGPFR